MSGAGFRGQFTAILTILATATAPAVTLVVTNVNDAGPGSLRQAILEANNAPGVNVIHFDLPGSGVRTLAPLTPWPDITNPVTLDGYSQPGSRPNSLTNGNDGRLLVRLDGVNLTNGLPIGLRFAGAGGHTVRGLILVRFFTAIQLDGSSANTIAGNWIGLDADGISRGGSGTGVDVTCLAFSRATANLIGGLSPGDRNVVAGFYTGVSFFPTSADHNTVQGNFIGTDASGALPRGNLFDGISVHGATNIIIGGGAPGARNLICGNGTGISLLGSSGNVIQGNFIGTDVTGRLDLGNAGDGIAVQGCEMTTIGGHGAGNLVGNNSGYGIFFLGCTNSVVQGNYVGADTTGTWAMGNGRDGIFLQGSGGIAIGSASAGLGNVIEFNHDAGVSIFSGIRNPISANSIFDNGGPGISLTFGANESQPAPVLTDAATAYGSTRASGYLNAQSSTVFRVEVFASPPWDATSTSEGQLYLGAASVTTDPAGSVSFSASLPVAAPVGSLVTATATDPAGNTSPFSAGIPASTGPPSVSLSISRSNNLPTITWPSAASGFQLESTGSFKPPVQWTTVTNGIRDDGVTRLFVATNAGSTAAQFFRLRR
jgi:hypothetical protein